MRLDIYITQHYGYSRNKVQSFIKNWLVSVNATICNKPSYEVMDSSLIEIAEAEEREWVSRSAGKLLGIFEALNIHNLHQKTALDIGSSTGGFTQILLQYGVNTVTAIDVGTEQLHPSLRVDSRVELHENTDIRTFTPWCAYDIITIDVSFISLREIVPVLSWFTHSDTDIYLLYKPQFEVGKTNLRKTWVPKDEKIVQKNLTEFQEFLIYSGYSVSYIMRASVVGEAGNQEYMLHVVGNKGKTHK